MAEFVGPNLNSVPLLALRSATREAICVRLNATKVIPTDEGVPRDWRGLAYIAGLESTLCVGSNDPTSQILHLWTACTIGVLIEALGQLDRYDIIDDTIYMIDNDAIRYTQNLERSYVSAPIVNLEVDKQVLTVDDVSRLERGLEPQYYDAFLLYADEDIDFAEQIVENMEAKYNLKLCLRDRDLVGGLTFEHEAIMRLISERCNRLIVVVSPSFLKSEANKFFVTFAQALGIEQRQRKVVPCLYQRCVLPPELSYYFLLDYSRSGTLWDFWAKMRDSLQVSTVRISNVVSIQEVEESSPQQSEKLELRNYSRKQIKQFDSNKYVAKSETLESSAAHNSSVTNDNTKSNVSTEKHSSSEDCKPKSGKWLRRLLPKQKSKKKQKEIKLAEAL